MSIILSNTTGLNSQGGLILIIYVVLIGGMFYLLSRPQKKEQKRIQ